MSRPASPSHRRGLVVPARANPERDITSRRGPHGSAPFAFIRGLAMAKIIETATGALALTFDDVLLQPGHSEVMPGETDVAHAHRRRHRAVNADPVGGDGHGDRIAAGHRHGAGRRHRRHPPQSVAGRAGRGGPPGQEVRIRHGRQPGDHRPRRDAGRRPRADARAWHFRHSGGRERRHRRPEDRPAGRHPHQPRRALRLRSRRRRSTS